MIFVAAGTTGFNALVKAMDELSQSLSERVVIQIGQGSYEPQHCEYFRFAPSLTPYYERASVVISHGGVGIMTEVLQHGRPLVAVEDVSQPERHQREILDALAQEGHLIWCKDLRKLSEAIELAKTQLKPYVTPECQIHTIVAEFLDSLNRK
jgi:UDP-N-acetylglucosamine transferase subunit ALG13